MKVLTLLYTSLFSGVRAQNGGNPFGWNPFSSPFSFENVPGAPAGFGSFSAFPTLSPMQAFQPLPSSFGNGFSDFNQAFKDMQSQFSNAVQEFSAGFANQNNANNPTPAPTAAPQTQPPPPQPTVAPPAPAPVAVPSPTNPTPSATTTSTPALTSAVPTAGQPIVIENRNCTGQGIFYGITPRTTDPCGSVECTCVKGSYLCYSNCNPPPSGQTCTPNFPAGSSDTCPTYSDCSPYTNTTVGDLQMFRCNGPVHPSVCWLYQIVFGKLMAPLAFFEAVVDQCPLASQCVCTNGFVQPAQLKVADFKTPARNNLYPRAAQGNKGTIAIV